MSHSLPIVAPVIPVIVTPEQLDAIARWAELKRWAKKELGQDLRRLGLSYGEISAVIPVSKGTLSGWCRDLPLTPESLERVAKNGTERAQRMNIGYTHRQRRLRAIEAIRRAGFLEAESLMVDSFWMAGVVAYWAEGWKRKNELGLSNSDSDMVSLFITWATKFLGIPRDRFTIRLHLHDGQNEDEQRLHWSKAIGLPLTQFRKGFLKQEGTGHRKNHLYHGTASIRVTKSTDLFHRVRGWIDRVKQPVNSR